MTYDKLDDYFGVLYRIHIIVLKTRWNMHEKLADACCVSDHNWHREIINDISAIK